MSVSLSIEVIVTSSSDDTNTVVLTSMILYVTILVLIICVTVLILKWKRKKDSTVGSNGIDKMEVDQQDKARPTIQHIPEQNQIDYHPQSKGNGTLS